MGEQIEGKRVLVTGICGTVGRELLRQLVAEGVAALVGLDNNESELFFLNQAYRDDPTVRLSLCDLRDRDALIRKMRGIDIIFHAAALKHVMICEEAPHQAVQTNIMGTQNVIDAASAHGVGRVLFTSTDKAVNPTNVMGTSKLMGERLFSAANLHPESGGPVFASTRFGNVLGSNGSVLPLFKRQIRAGGPVTVTDPEMTRFIMTLEEAVDLVKRSVFLARGGEVFVTKMPAIRIGDLAAIMIEELAPRHGHDPQSVRVDVIGPRTGEKRYEELINEEETRRTLEIDDYFVVLPTLRDPASEPSAAYGAARRLGLDEAYNSHQVPVMDRDALRGYLREHRLLEPESSSGTPGGAPA